MLQKLIFLSIIAGLFSINNIADAAEIGSMPTSVQPFSPYGQIQNVQNYSSNPFWTPDAPYNQRPPQPVYLQGPSVTTSDCQRIVSALVSAYCSVRNNCIKENLEDAKPTIIIQLSNLPNHNYVSACVGYIDTEFDKYKETYSYVGPKTDESTFSDKNYYYSTDSNNVQVEISNSYTNKQPADWLVEKKQREQNIKNAQAQNTDKYPEAIIPGVSFPETISDLSFEERLENDKAGFEPYKKLNTYPRLDGIETGQQNTEPAKTNTSDKK